MKKWMPISAIIVVGLGVVGVSISSSRSSGHHELIDRLDSKMGKVELYWDAPQKTDKKLAAIVYVHGVQGEGRPGAINLVKGDVLSSTAKMGYFAAAMSMPGYGQSSGKGDFCGRESQLALQSTVAYLRNRPDVDSNNIAVLGFSCGAVVASMIADKER